MSKKKVIAKVLGIEDESQWLSSEKVNIFIAAFVSPLLALIGTIIKAIIQKKNCISTIVDTIQKDWFIDFMQLLTIACTILVIYRLRRSILITKTKRPRLFTYIREKCKLRDQSVENVNRSLYEVEKTVTQFYYVWIMLWVVFFIYYGCNLCFHLFDKFTFLSIDENKKLLIYNGFNNFFNYLSSTMMLILFIILSSVTVSLEDKKYRNELVSSVMFIVIFGCIILFPTLFSLSLYSWSYFKLQLIISFVLGLYSAFAFVLVLGKLNTNLQIPRFFFYFLYVYALIQTFQFLFISYPELEHKICSCNDMHIRINYDCFCADPEYHTCNCDSSIVGQFVGSLKDLYKIFQYVTLIGKIFLSLTLLWIAYESKFIYFVIHQSQTITDMPYRMSVFKTYMKDTD